MCPFLGTDFSLATFFVFAFVFGRFNDIGGGWFGGIAGVLFKGSDFGFELDNFFLELGDAYGLFLCQFFPIHRRNVTLFRQLTKDQF